MARYQITNVRKPDRSNSHEHITHVGNLSENWIITREEVIHRIVSGRDTFYVVDPIFSWKHADVRVVYPAGRQPYIRTYADGDWGDNLLSLPPC